MQGRVSSPLQTPKSCMSTYIPLGKNPGSPEERQELIARREAEEERLAGLDLAQVRSRIIDYLLSRKGYSQEELETEREFRVELPEGPFTVRADIILKEGGVRFMVVKCALSSLESWERHSIAFCRVVEPYQIPYAVITDGERARVMNILKKGEVSEGLESIPSKREAPAIVRALATAPYPEEKRVKEKRMLYAFDGIKCPAEKK